MSYIFTLFPEIRGNFHNYTYDNPEQFFKTQHLNTDHPHFLPGAYGNPWRSGGYWVHKSAPEFGAINKRGQGWKIHITAMPQSAKKIAELILPQIDGLPHQVGSRVSFKIIQSLPLMRTLWSYINVQGSETQPGKFIVLYPDNWVHSYELVKKIDGILNTALEEGTLDQSDFLPLVGDAQVGTSGGVYIRYGRYTQGRMKKLTPMDETMPLEMNVFEEDDRFYPWPDFMNKANPFWGHHESPFHEVPITWTSFKNSKHKISSWNNRPISWANMVDNEEEEKELERSKDMDEKMESAARAQQIEADRLYAEELNADEIRHVEQEKESQEQDRRLAYKLQQDEEESIKRENEEQVKADEELARKLQGEYEG